MENQIAIDIVGIIAGTLIVLSLLPQIVTIIRNKSSKDVSILTYTVLFVAQCLWISYGVLKHDLEITITNILSGFLTLIIILCSLYYIKYPLFNNNNNNNTTV